MSLKVNYAPTFKHNWFIVGKKNPSIILLANWLHICNMKYKSELPDKAIKSILFLP